MTMRRLTTILIVMVSVVPGVFAQVDRLETYQANFSSSNLETKLEILRAADEEDAAEFGPLYGQALSYVVSNAEELYSEPLLREIALKAVRRIDDGEYTPAVNDLWRLFRLYDETTVRIQVLNVIGAIAVENPDEIAYISEWVATQNKLQQADTRVDFQVLAAALTALGNLASPVSFQPVLDAILVQFPDFVTAEARRALDALEGSPLGMASETIRGKDVLDKTSAFSFFMTDDYLSDADRLELARFTLVDALGARPTEIREQEALRQLRFAAVGVIREGGYAEATNAIIRHFNETVLEFDRGRITKNRVLEAIAALGAMGNDEAAARLTDYLELLNIYTERDRSYDTQILLATIRNLEILDSPLAYNALFKTTLLENYPDRVRDAARKASREVSR